MRSISTRFLLAATATLVACTSDSTGPSLGNIEYTFTEFDTCTAVGCDTAQRALQAGDTIGFEVYINGPTPDSSAIPELRPSCAVNLAVRRNGGSGAPLTVPVTATCPDSVIIGGDNWPGGGIHTDRVYIWKIPGSFAAGTYTVTSKVLVKPRVDRTATFTVH